MAGLHLRDMLHQNKRVHVHVCDCLSSNTTLYMHLQTLELFQGSKIVTLQGELKSNEKTLVYPFHPHSGAFSLRSRGG